MKSDFLHRFIRALDEGELRYCRTSIELDEKQVAKGYLCLFDRLAAMGTHDAKALATAMAHFPIAKQLAAEKIRLYQLLLQFTKELRDKRKPANDPQLRLDEALLLYDKGLHEEAVEVATKGLAQAVFMENLWLEVVLMDLLRRIYKAMAQKQLTATRIQNEYQLLMAGKKLSTLLLYTQISDRMFDYIRNYRATDSSTVKRGIDELMNTPELQDINLATSLPAQIRFYSIQQFYYSQQNKLEETNEMCKRQLSLWEQNPARIAEDPSVYRGVLSNLIGKLTLLGKTEEAFSYLNKLETMKVVTRRDEVLQFGHMELQFQLFYMNQGKMPEVLLREENVLAGLRRYQKAMEDSVVLVLMYNLGITHLICENRTEAMRYFDRIHSLGKLPVRLDLQGIARLIRLLLLYDKEENRDVSHFLRNSNLFFGKKDRKFELEHMVHQWLALHNDIVGKSERKQSFGQFAETLVPFMQSNVLGAEEMYIWAKARHRGVPLMQVLNERLKPE